MGRPKKGATNIPEQLIEQLKEVIATVQVSGQQQAPLVSAVWKDVYNLLERATHKLDTLRRYYQVSGEKGARYYVIDEEGRFIPASAVTVMKAITRLEDLTDEPK